MKNQTKLAFQNSFHALLRVKSLDKITVRDIVEDCGLTRNTFYYHYEDIYDLFDDFLDTKMQQILSTLPPDSPWEEALVRFMEELFQTPRMGRHIFYSKKQDTLRRYLHRLVEVILEQHMENAPQKQALCAEDRRLICDTCCHALYGLLEQWITGPEAPAIRQKMYRFSHCFEGSIRQAVEYCVQHPERRERL